MDDTSFAIITVHYQARIHGVAWGRASLFFANPKKLTAYHLSTAGIFINATSGVRCQEITYKEFIIKIFPTPVGSFEPRNSGLRPQSGPPFPATLDPRLTTG
jgi:hypothetical protein